MIKISNTLRRNTLTPALSALVAAGLLATAGNAQAAQVDAQILAAISAAGTQDIEAIAASGGAIGDKIGTGEIKAAKKNIKALASGLSDAIIAKISASPPSPTDRNRLDNKADEIGELAAFIQQGLANNPKYQANKRASGTKQTITLIKGALSTEKKSGVLFGTSVIRDVAGSVALTIHNHPLVSDVVEEKIQKKLLKPGVAKKLAGKANVTAITTGLTEGFDGGAPSELKYEDGNMDNLTTITDPETDFRPA